MTTTTKRRPKNEPKPPYSKDGRLQLCSRCNRYCGRTKNTCPTCDKRYDDQKIAIKQAGLNEIRFRDVPHMHGEKHFVGTINGKDGYFVVWGNKQILDRATFKEIAAEAKERGLTGKFFIVGRICTYIGAGIEFIQLGANSY